ncbi:MAG TPA: hypothetical protein VNN76_05895 [Bacteroidota bacterium]|nr:hypothetical protein [Bacteroidota bacterium]
MKLFRVSLHRDYIVQIEARNEKEAKRLTEFYLTTPVDGSRQKDREEHSFRIEEIEMVTNDAIEVEEVEQEI